tara:strand:- start:321 stop:1130 length:810 start_codon:yes stop_codon:yes gene_type:complete
MKTIKLQKVDHNIKMGKECPYYEPNIKEDCLLEVDGEIIGFYINNVDDYNKKLTKLIAIANKEFRSDNVPKSNMARATVPNKEQYELMKRGLTDKKRVSQYSTILGGIAPKAQFKRPYPNQSSVHTVKSAQTFIKSMWGACLEAERIIKKLTPHIYERQINLFKDVKNEWKFGTIYTGSISNFNIAAPFHRDTGNIVGTVNTILTKRNNSQGGCLNVPDYNVTFEQADNSMLVYPAWKNMHGVTPIKQITEDGYRNSLIFYPLKAFKGI